MISRSCGRALGRPAVAALAVALLTGGAPGLPAQTAAPPSRWETLVRAFDTYARSDGVVGGRVMAIRNGQPVADHIYGLGDRERGTPPAPEAVYHWASITKTLTAIAIMQLRDHGRLRLDDPITRWVPELRQVHDTFGSVDQVTLRMLLSHSAGFQNPTWPYREGRPWEPFEPTRWEQLVSMMPYQEVGFRPGSRFGYSNPGFIYLGRVVEALSGDPWAVYIQKNIWTPLGMTRSFVGTSPYHLAPLRAASYTVHADSGRTTTDSNAREFDPGITRSNSGWNAPMSDLVTYVAFLTHATAGDARRALRYDGVLRRGTLEEMWRPVVPLSANAGMDDAFGLSFYLYRRGAHRVVGHTGEQSGFRSFLYFDPATTEAVVGVVNTTNEANSDGSNRGWDDLTQQAITMVASP
ncbi:MAG: serine hydrolase domain-containing protein [Gemmatimonadales bacterium]